MLELGGLLTSGIKLHPASFDGKWFRLTHFLLLKMYLFKPFFEF